MEQPLKARSTRAARRGALGVIGVTVLIAAALSLSASGASASGTADLSVSQTVSNGATAGQTIITDHVHNAGPSTATNIVTVALVKTTSSLSYASQSATCQQEPAPSGWNFMFTCEHSSIAAGVTWIPKFTLTGTTGATLTRFLSVGENGESDPNFANNSSTLNTYLGAEADLSVSQAATAGTSSGHVTITATVKNHGPWTANSLQLVTEINSPGFSSVGASSSQSASCQFIPPASGFNSATSCTTSSLAPGKTWKVTFSYVGTPGGGLTTQATVSANNPNDPATANNVSTKSTSYAS